MARSAAAVRWLRFSPALQDMTTGRAGSMTAATPAPEESATHRADGRSGCTALTSAALTSMICGQSAEPRRPASSSGEMKKGELAM
jgi:hypothetical protein